MRVATRNITIGVGVVLTIAVAGLSAVASAVRPYVIPTGSMEDTLLIGDRILVEGFPKAGPARGDMVVFLYPPDRTQTHIKRVVGISGDRIRITRKVLLVNGAAPTEPYIKHADDYEDSYRDNFPSQPQVELPIAVHDMLEKHVVNGEVVVPAEAYFVLGDNRDSSLDSRYFGFVRGKDVIGKPFLIYGSVDSNGRLRTDRLFKKL